MRPKTAPTHRENGSGVLHSPPSTTSHLRQQYRTSKSVHTQSSRLLNEQRRVSKNVYRRSSSINHFTQALIADILPTKFRPLSGTGAHGQQKSKRKKRMRNRSGVSSVFSESGSICPNSPRRSLRRPRSSPTKRAGDELGGFGSKLRVPSMINNLKINLSDVDGNTLPLQRQSFSNTRKSRPKSAFASKRKRKSVSTKKKKKPFSTYQKYSLMDEVQRDFFELQRKHDLKEDYLKKQKKILEEINMEEDLRQRALNDCLAEHPTNVHLISTRAESNWMQHLKDGIYDLQQEIRDLELRKATVDEYYSTDRSKRIKESMIQITKKLAKLRVNLNQHLRDLGFDQSDIYDITEQLTEFSEVMKNICDIELLVNNCENKLNLVRKECILSEKCRERNCDMLYSLTTDLERILNQSNDPRIDFAPMMMGVLDSAKSFCCGEDDDEKDGKDEIASPSGTDKYNLSNDFSSEIDTANVEQHDD